METEKMHEIYQKIAEQVDDMIPEDWSKLYLYAEVLDDSSTVYFYFYSTIKNQLVYCHNIPDDYNVSEEIFDKLWLELTDYFEELHKEFKENNPTPWTNLTMYLDIQGDFKIDFNYDDVLAVDLGPHGQRIIWEYKVLDIYPTDKSDQKLIDEYIQKNPKE